MFSRGVGGVERGWEWGDIFHHLPKTMCKE